MLVGDAPALPGAVGQWLHISEYAKGAGGSEGYFTDVVYPRGVRQAGGLVSSLAAGGAPPVDLVSKHLWGEREFPDLGSRGVADARTDCGAKGRDGILAHVLLTFCSLCLRLAHVFGHLSEQVMATLTIRWRSGRALQRIRRSSFRRGCIGSLTRWSCPPAVLSLG